MSINLSANKVADHEMSSSTKFDALVQAAQDAFNKLGDPVYGAWAAGKIFDLAKIKQNGAVIGQVPMWDGSQWVPTTPPGGAYAILADSLLVGDGVFSFQNIPQTSTHLQLVLYLRSDRANVSDDLGVRFNNDSTANYDSYAIQTSGVTPTHTPTENLAATSGRCAGGVAGSSATANVFSAVFITIPHYTGAVAAKTANIVAVKKVGTATGNLHLITAIASWRTTNAAISRIDLLLTAGGTNFKAGSRATLYGL